MSENKSAGYGNLTYYIIGAIIAAIATGFFAPKDDATPSEPEPAAGD